MSSDAAPDATAGPEGAGTPPVAPVAGAADPAFPGPRDGRAPRRLVLLLGLVAAVVLLLDVLTKVAVVASLDPAERVTAVPGLLWVTLARNSGAAFSLGQGATVLFTAVAVGVVVVIVRAASRLRSAWWAVALGLLLGGATGNLVDRLFRWPGPFRGHVVDWIQVPHWPVFNVADSCVVVGGIMIVCLAALGVPLDGQPEQPAATAGGGRPSPAPQRAVSPDRSSGSDRSVADRTASTGDGAPRTASPGDGAARTASPGDGAARA